ncbi:MAG: hypothetical protein OFPII_36710 [Osedax symbiont Rs1]|nr:MAG: hypothetical protein OFPII_36710 [Osedax symbiont Rs1]
MGAERKILILHRNIKSISCILKFSSYVSNRCRVAKRRMEVTDSGSSFRS